MKLVKPTKQYEQSWHEALAEFKAENRKGFWNWNGDPTNLDDYIQQTQNDQNGTSDRPNWVPSTTFWLIDNNEFIGHTNIRHHLNEYLNEFGGHIGYYIRPSKRGQGYGNKILELALIQAQKIGLQKVLITCDESNTASQKIIKKHNGKFDGKTTGDGEPKLRYWIEI